MVQFFFNRFRCPTVLTDQLNVRWNSAGIFPWIPRGIEGEFSSLENSPGNRGKSFKLDGNSLENWGNLGIEFPQIPVEFRLLTFNWTVLCTAMFYTNISLSVSLSLNSKIMSSFCCYRTWCTLKTCVVLVLHTPTPRSSYLSQVWWAWWNSHFVRSRQICCHHTLVVVEQHHSKLIQLEWSLVDAESFLTMNA